MIDIYNYTNMSNYTAQVPLVVVDPYDQIIIFLLILIAFCQLLLLMNSLRSYITDRGEN
jgi:hypothetical protein